MCADAASAGETGGEILEIYLAGVGEAGGMGSVLHPRRGGGGPMGEAFALNQGFVGEIENITIHFRPTGLSRLFGVPDGHAGE